MLKNRKYTPSILAKPAEIKPNFIQDIKPYNSSHKSGASFFSKVQLPQSTQRDAYPWASSPFNSLYVQHKSSDSIDQRDYSLRE